MIKFVYNTAAEVPEALKEHYTEKDGKFVLQCEGVKPSNEFETMQTSLNAARADVSRFKGILAKFGEHTPETISAMEEELAGLKTGKSEDIEARVSAQVEVRTKNLARDLAAATQRAEKAEGDVKALKSEFNTSKIDVAVMNVGSERFRKEAIQDAQLYARNDFEIDESGNVVTKETCTLGAGLSVAQWADKMLETKTHWENENTAGKSKGGRERQQAGNNPWAKESFNVTEQHRIMLADPTKAAAMKKAAGIPTR